MSRSSAEQQLREQLPLAAREPGGGLVEHQHLRLGGERHRERDLALLAVREVADELGELVVDRDAAGRLPRPLAHLAVACAETHRAELAAARRRRSAR